MFHPLFPIFGQNRRNLNSEIEFSLQTSYTETNMRLWLTTFVSIVLHLSLFWAVHSYTPPMSHSDMINLTLVNAPVDLQVDYAKKPAKYQGARNLRFKEQRRVEQPQIFPKINDQIQLPQGKQDKMNATTKSEKDNAPEIVQKDLEMGSDLPMMPLINLTMSPTDDDLIKGNFTAVDTDMHIYSSFFTRMHRQVYLDWVQGLRKLINRDLPLPEVMRELVNRKRTTEVEFWLLPNGRFHSAHVMRESGVLALDDRHIEAFMAAKTFPNPPRGLLDDDGFVKFTILFELTVNPESVAKSVDP